MGYRRRTTMAGFGWRTLVVGSELQVNTTTGSGLRTKNDSGELQMENCSNGL